MTINNQVDSMKKKQAARKRAEELGQEYESDDEEEEDAVPMITMPMLQMALKDSSRSVTPAVYQKYLEMKMQFDREGGKTAVDKAQISGLPWAAVAVAEARPPQLRRRLGRGTTRTSMGTTIPMETFTGKWKASESSISSFCSKSTAIFRVFMGVIGLNLFLL